ncbi:MAG: hypothetical protein ACKOX6_12915 [Bdellovibrio sp.]
MAKKSKVSVEDLFMDTDPGIMGVHAERRKAEELKPEPIMSQRQTEAQEAISKMNEMADAAYSGNLSQTRANHEPISTPLTWKVIETEAERIKKEGEKYIERQEKIDPNLRFESKLSETLPRPYRSEKLEPNLSQDHKQVQLDYYNGLRSNHEPIIGQTEAIHEPKVSQTRANHKPQPEPIMSQSEAIHEPNVSQSWAKPEPQPEPLHEPKLSQTRAKHEPKSRDLRNIHSLIGLQRDALNYIFQNCVTGGSRISSSIAVQNMAMALKTTSAAVRKAVQRLEHDKRFIERYAWKDGRGGWTKYEIFEDIYSQLVMQSRAIHEPNISQSRAKVEPQLRPQLEPKTPYSSSVNLKNENTNTVEVPDNLKPFGISAVNLQRVVETGKCSFEIVQRSLEALSFDVSKGKKKNVANILFGVLNKGGEYVSQEYAQDLQKELQAEFKRIEEAEAARRQLEELVAKRKWEEYKAEHPTWIDVYRAQNPFGLSDERLEQVAFEDFKGTEWQGG